MRLHSLVLAAVCASSLCFAQDLTPKDPWPEVNELIHDQKHAEALTAVEKRLAEAREKKDELGVARALVRATDLRISLGRIEEGLQFLRKEAWPKELKARAAVQLMYAQSLESYFRAYRYELGRRTAKEGEDSPASWTSEQTEEELNKAYLALFAVRDPLGRLPVDELSDFIAVNNFPRNVRGTLRDAVTYMFAERLLDRSSWSVEDSNSMELVKLSSLLAGSKNPGGVVIEKNAHPLTRASALLDDLELFHKAAGRKEAAFEARRFRAESLSRQYALAEDQDAIRADLERSLEQVKGLPWWSMGQATLAGLYRNEDTRKAHELAAAGEKAFPKSEGGLTCRALREQLELPSLSLQAMSVDGAKKRSILLTHQNVTDAFFRAYPIDLEKRVAGKLGEGLVPEEEALWKLLRSKPLSSWHEKLPATADYRPHHTFVTPPLEKLGSYLVFVSNKETFESGTDVSGVLFTVSDLVLVASGTLDGRTHVRAISGSTGRPIPGASIQAYAMDWNTDRYNRILTATTDSTGRASFKIDNERWYQVMAIAKKDKDVAFTDRLPSPYEEERTDRNTVSLIYTDRTVYRPGQTLQFKVVVFKYDNKGRVTYAARPNANVTLSLHDANGQEVAKQKLKTNAFGSASGKLELPTGRRLGHWSLRTDVEGSAAIVVEEYKRPTFESKLERAGQMRLNQPAKVMGESRYYFGLPVRGAEVKWTVRREPGYLPYALWLPFRPQEQAQIIGSGTVRTGEDGKFSFEFTPLADERRVRTYGLLYRYRVTATVLDEGGESHDVVRSYPVGLVSVSASISHEQELYLADSAPSDFAAMRTSVDGAPAPGKGSWTLSELTPPTDGMLPADLPPPPVDPRIKQERTPGDGLNPRWAELPEATTQLRSWKPTREVAKGELTHGEDGRAAVALPKLSAGIYRLRYVTKDDRGEEATAQQDVIVGANAFRPKLALLLTLESASVEVGGTARLLAASGIEGMPMELEILRPNGKIERRQLDGSNALIELPIRTEDRGGIAFSLTAVKDHQLLTATTTVDVPFSDRELDVTFSTFRDSLRPGVKETWKVTVKPRVGQEKLSAEVLAYMYDRSLDVFAGHGPPSPSSYLPWAPEPPYWENASGEMSYAFGVYYVQREIAPPPDLRSDELRLYGRYAIGGPGGRSESALVERKMKAAPMKDGKIAANGKGAGYGAGAGIALGGKLKDGEGKLGKEVAAPPPVTGAVKREESAATPQPGTELRANFNESAFFFPHLLTGPDGTVSIEFTPPDSVTEWNVWAHALTKDMKYGSATMRAKTSKDFLVRPYVPRFFREGDKAELRVVLTNASAGELKGDLSLELLDPSTQRSVSSAWGLSTAKKAFTLPGHGSQTLTFAVAAPREVGEVAFKAVGTAGTWTDGELRSLPLLPSRLHLSQSRFVVLKGAGEKAISFEELDQSTDKTLQSEQLVVTVDAQLFESVLAALPYLIEYPYECTEQTLNRFISTGIVSAVMTKYPEVAKKAKQFSERKTPLEQFDRPDPNRKAQLEETPWLVEAKGGEVPKRARMYNVLDPKVSSAHRDAALQKLKQMQNADGGFPWFPGGPSSLYMTLYLLNGFSRGVEYGVPIPKDMVTRAWRYIGHELRNSNWKAEKSDEVPAEWLTFLAYVWTAYPDNSWLGGAVAEADVNRIVERAFARWRELPPYMKSMLAVTLARKDRQEDGRKVFESVMDSSRSDERLGVYWAAEDKSWMWYRDTIETHAMALQTLSALTPKDERRSGLVQWLFLNKKLNQWKSTRATAEVIYALVKYMDSEGLLGVPEEPKVTVATPSKTFDFEPAKGELRAQWVVPGELVKPPTKISVSKPTKGTVFTTATWHFATDELPTKGDGDLLLVSRAYSKSVVEGTRAKLVPLKSGMEVQLGDELEVELHLKALHEAEYVHVRDPRGAGFEPVSQRSYFKWEGGVGFYEEVRDTGTNFFFERLPVGEYTLRYKVRASMSGVFRVGPAFAQSMYAPEFTAYSAGATLQVH